ncbi:hypothetical protein DRJ22_02295 [Candidatus Woesearchaeota archaeon]|nr:MAG: hypothetical protein B6U93_02945 [Candidatus Woesearchaeota archaeon ex4484_78]RLE46306.1 MAG: hypothetical protein DRJ22_02295 [Candidatus Woesearchaeota archaeon]
MAKKPKKTAKSRKKTKSKIDITKYDIDKLLKKEGILNEKRKKTISKAMLISAGVLIIVIIGILLYLMPAPGNVKVCKTDACFIKAANECTPAVLEKKIATTTLRLEIKEGCVLNKKVIGMDSSEPKEVRDLFENAEMDCYYDKGKFDPTYVTQISGNLGYCSGPLVDAILAVL